MDQEIVEYIRERIIPFYRNFDPAHREDHVKSVIASALEMGLLYNLNQNMVAMAAACHDLGLSEDRKTHHIVSGRIIRENADLRKWFSEEQIEIIAQAAEDHRASSGNEPRTIYGKIIAEADRQINPEAVIRRTVQYGLEHCPELDKEGHWQRTLAHLNEKYSETGYLKLWIPESANAGELKRLRAIIRDEVLLRGFFEKIYRNETQFLHYSMGREVEAFTAMRDAELPYPILCGHQVHGHKVGVVNREGMTREDFEGYDALITNLPVAIGVRTADCIPVLLFDPVNKAVAAIHAGWRGTVQKIVCCTVLKMVSTYRTDPQNLVAAIGPGIGFDSFRVGEEVTVLFKEAGFPLDVVWKLDGIGHHIDLKAANKLLLMSEGVKEENIFVSDLDTYTDIRLFSARRDGTECERNINAVRLLQ